VLKGRHTLKLLNALRLLGLETIVRKYRYVTLAVFLSALFILAGCSSNNSSKISAIAPGAVMLAVTSPAFGEGETIPGRYTCAGEDISPPLNWSGTPVGTESFVIIMTDPDAPGGEFTHWIVFNIPAESIGLEEDIPGIPELADGTRQLQNSFRDLGYGGPCPPAGKAHHYIFTFYALDTALDMADGAGISDILDAIEGHILGQGALTGLCQR
jgi:Raf kinase inhibitor-like YbhB/YbcL family protein